MGIHYIEGGYPGSNPKDADFFNRAKEISLASAVLVAFGSTRKPGNEVEKDEALRAVLDAGTAVITLVGKTSKSQVLEVLETTEEELISTIFPHPTLSEAMHESVMDAFGKVIHF